MAGMEGVGKVVGTGGDGGCSLSEDELEELLELEDWYSRLLETSSSDSL